LTCLVTGAAVVVFLFQGFADLLVYDRTAIASGQAWRLVTGNLVHFSNQHFFYNGLTFLVMGCLVERRRYPQLALLCISSASLIGLALYFLAPAISVYGGLSGVDCALVIYLGLNGIGKRERWPFLYAGILSLTLLKISLEYAWGGYLFVDAPEHGFVPVPLAHVVGSVTAVAVCALTRWRHLRMAA
jgi:rhomboid family GlyGly-CTERM serine protease